AKLAKSTFVRARVAPNRRLTPLVARTGVAPAASIPAALVLAAVLVRPSVLTIRPSLTRQYPPYGVGFHSSGSSLAHQSSGRSASTQSCASAGETYSEGSSSLAGTGSPLRICTASCMATWPARVGKVTAPPWSCSTTHFSQPLYSSPGEKVTSLRRPDSSKASATPTDICPAGE